MAEICPIYIFRLPKVTSNESLLCKQILIMPVDIGVQS